MDLRIEVDTAAAATPVVVLRGSLDVQSRGDLIRIGQQTLAAGAVSTLILDLTGITFIDSTGLGALVELSHDADEADAAFRIRNPSARVTRILDLTGLTGSWAIERDPAGSN